MRHLHMAPRWLLIASLAGALLAGCDDGDASAEPTPDAALVGGAGGGAPDEGPLTADAGVLDMELPDGEAPDADARDADLRDVEVPDVEVPDVEVPDVEVPDAEVPDAEVPDVEVPDAEAPDAEIPDAELPDAACANVGPETCNSLDDDCDGEIDEGVAGRLCFLEGVGRCGHGVTTCEGGVEGCAQQFVPEPEICDRRDNDCDGLTDEGLGEAGVITPVPAHGDVSLLEAAWISGYQLTASISGGELSLRVGAASAEAPGELIGEALTVPLGAASPVTPSVASGEGPDGLRHAVAYVRPGAPQDGLWVSVVDGAGEPVGPGGVELSEEARGTEPSIVWADGRFAVAWTDGRVGNDEIYFALLDADGGPIGEPQRISVALGRSRLPRLVRRPEGFGLFWIDRRSGVDQLYYVALDDDGGRYTPEVQLGALPTVEVDAVWDDYGFSVMFASAAGAEEPSIYLWRSNHQGQPLEEAPRIVGVGWSPAIEHNGNQLVMAWRNAAGDILLARRGREPQGALEPTTLNPDEPAGVGPYLLTSGARSAVMARGGLGEEGPVLSIGGELGGCSGRLSCTPAEHVEVLSCGEGLCRQDPTPSACVDGFVTPCRPGLPAPVEFACDGADEDCNGVIDDPPVINGEDVLWMTAPAEPTNPEAVWTGESVGVAWLDERGPGVEVFFRIFTDDGVPMTPEVQLTDHGARAGGLKVVYTGGNFGVSWHDNRAGNDDVYFALLDGEGALVGEVVPITDGPGRQQTPDLSFDGTHFNIVWRDFRAGEGNEIYFSQLSAEGALVVDQRRLTVDPGTSVSPAIASHGRGGGHGVVWRDSRDGAIELWFRFLDPEGAPLDAEVQLTEGADPITPSLVWTGAEYGLAWVERRGGNEDIWFQRLSFQGTPIGAPAVVSEGPGRALSPRLLWTGGGYAIIWDEDATGLFREAWYRTISAEGEALGAPLRVSADSWTSEAPTLIFTGLEFLALYDDFRNRRTELFTARGVFGGCTLVEACLEGASPEVVDGRDNDCDGLLDEQAP